MQFALYLVPDGIDHGKVALHSGEEDSISRDDDKIPHYESRKPNATYKLVVDTLG